MHYVLKQVSYRETSLLVDTFIDVTLSYIHVCILSVVGLLDSTVYSRTANNGYSE